MAGELVYTTGGLLVYSSSGKLALGCQHTQGYRLTVCSGQGQYPQYSNKCVAFTGTAPQIGQIVQMPDFYCYTVSATSTLTPAATINNAFFQATCTECRANCGSCYPNRSPSAIIFTVSGCQIASMATRPDGLRVSFSVSAPNGTWTLPFIGCGCSAYVPWGGSASVLDNNNNPVCTTNYTSAGIGIGFGASQISLGIGLNCDNHCVTPMTFGYLNPFNAQVYGTNMACPAYGGAGGNSAWFLSSPGACTWEAVY